MIGRLTEQEINEVLAENVIGRLGCSSGNKTYVVPVSYIYDGESIIAHSLAGMKINMMRENPKVCFEVDEIRSFTHWKSVICWGEYQELTNELESYAAMKLFVDRMMHLKISETATLPELTTERVHPRSPGIIKPVIYKIHVTEKTGRFETPS